MRQLKRIISPKGILIFLCLAVISLTAGVQKVSAVEQKSYLIKVNRACNTITIYGMDDSGVYTVPIQAMACSVGIKGKTITGTFQTKERYRWKALMGDVWGQYATRIVGGILFHSVYYYENGNPASLATKEFNKLGTAASHGCIRLTVEDAKWIYDNCSTGTTVIIYDDRNDPGPLGKPEVVKLSKSVRWDPTDPNLENPYRVNLPQIYGLKDVSIEWGETIDLLGDVTAVSSVGADITSLIEVSGTVDDTKPGDYSITYSVTDAMNKIAEKTITVTVKECLADPEIVGVQNKLVTGKITIDNEFALKGVDLYRGKVKLDKSLIKVTIDKVDEENYSIEYKAVVDNKTSNARASVHIDREAPVITGVKDFTIEVGEIPNQAYITEEISVSDNYSDLKNIKLITNIIENPDGTFQLIYVASDEAGNIVTAKAKVNY